MSFIEMLPHLIIIAIGVLGLFLGWWISEGRDYYQAKRFEKMREKLRNEE